MKMNKEAQGFSMGTLLALILAVVILVLLVLALSGTFGNWDDIKSNLFGNKVNVQTVINGCQLSCSTSSTYDYCKARDIYFEKKGPKQTKTCRELEGQYGLEPCQNIDCGMVQAAPAGGSLGETPSVSSPTTPA